MPYTEALESIKGSLLLNNGTTTTGAIRTISQTLGDFNKNAWDIDKVGAIVTAVAPIFSKNIYRVHGVKTYSISG